MLSLGKVSRGKAMVSVMKPLREQTTPARPLYLCTETVTRSHSPGGPVNPSNFDSRDKYLHPVSWLWYCLLRYRSRCQDDIFPRIELIPSFVLSSDNTNCKNDIQLFHQLFDELSVYRDYH